MRPSGRNPDQLREIALEPEVARYAEGSCMSRFGHTHVLCTASVEDGVPPFLRNSGKGWVTAEYGMLPRSTHSRMDRRRTADSGRSQEISRLIGRSLRAVVDTKRLGERQIRVDCDVIQADGGTRTAAITGGFVALALAIRHLRKLGAVESDPLIGSVAAISCGLFQGTPVLDLDYDEDSNADADANFVLTGAGGIVEIQGTAEGAPFSEEQFIELLRLARTGCAALTQAQNSAIGGEP
ncbi:MAG: ribonuclease PH [Alphaproteobacteria bacterium]